MDGFLPDSGNYDLGSRPGHVDQGAQVSQDPNYPKPWDLGPGYLIPHAEELKVDMGNMDWLFITPHNLNSGKLLHLRWNMVESIQNDWNYNVGFPTSDTESTFHATFITMATGNIHPVSETPEQLFQMVQKEIDKMLGIVSDIEEPKEEKE